MGFINFIRGLVTRMFRDEAKKEFGVEPIISTELDEKYREYIAIYSDKPYWRNDVERSLCFGKTIAEEVARLVSLDIGIETDNEVLNDVLQKFLKNVRDDIEYATAIGCCVFKPNGAGGVDIVTPDNFLVTNVDADKNITGMIFFDYYQQGNEYYTRMEWQRFVEESYVITNRAYVSKDSEKIGREIELKDTPTWKDVLPELVIGKADGSRLEGTMFSIFNMPFANNIDAGSPLGISIYSNSLTELQDLDITYSKYMNEIDDSDKIVLVDDRLMMETGKKLTSKRGLKLPRFVRNVFGSDAKEFYQEIVPTLNVEQRLQAVNNQLSMIGFKCGFSNGYFILNEKTGMVTATQVESDDRRTIQLVKDIRDNLQNAIDGLAYALQVESSLNGQDIGEYEINYSFGDITYNYAEDKAQWYQYAMQNKIPFWYYLVKYEKMSEEEAKELIDEAAEKEEGLFEEGGIQ